MTEFKPRTAQVVGLANALGEQDIDKVEDLIASEPFQAIIASAQAQATTNVRSLVRDLTDPGDCWYDHHGGCQEHYYLDLDAGQVCPHEEAREWLRKSADA